MRLAHSFVTLVILTVTPALVVAQDTSLVRVIAAFEQAKIPADLAIAFRPSALLHVSFPQPGGERVTLAAGVQLPRNATVGPPILQLQRTGAGDNYQGPFVVATVDPDAPTPQDSSVAQVRHYLAGDLFLGDRIDLKGLLQNRTEALTPWLQPGPPSFSPAHRYVFLLYKQPENFAEQRVVTPGTSLIYFNISAFAEEVGLGSPIAGTFMLVAPDAPNPPSSPTGA